MRPKTASMLKNDSELSDCLSDQITSVIYFYNIIEIFF